MQELIRHVLTRSGISAALRFTLAMFFARWRGGSWFPGTFMRTNDDGTMYIVFEDGDVQANTPSYDVVLKGKAVSFDIDPLVFAKGTVEGGGDRLSKLRARIINVSLF